MKKWINLILVGLLMFMITACKQTIEQREQAVTQSDEESAELNVAVLSGPTGMGMAKLIQNNENGETANDYQFIISSDPSDVLAKVISGEYDVAALPTNSAAIAYAKSKGAVQMLAINTYGTLYLLQNTELELKPIEQFSELRGKTIATFGQGANPEYILNYVLEQNGLTIGEDIAIEFYATAEEVMAAAVSGNAHYVMLPEPSVSALRSKNSKMVTIFDLTKVWDECTASPLVMGSLVVSTKFAAEHPTAIAAFLEEYEISVNYTHSNPSEAAALIAEYGIVANAEFAATALENCSLICITGAEQQETIQGYYEILFDYNPAAVGGAVPDEAFYYVTK